MTPFENRKCRDVFWLLCYIVFWGVMLFVGGYAFAEGALPCTSQLCFCPGMSFKHAQQMFFRTLAADPSALSSANACESARAQKSLLSVVGIMFSLQSSRLPLTGHVPISNWLPLLLPPSASCLPPTATPLPFPNSLSHAACRQLGKASVRRRLSRKRMWIDEQL